MVRLVSVAIVTGIVLGVSMGFAVKGLDVEGAMAGIMSIVLLAGVSSFFFVKYRKALQECHS